MEIKDYKFCKDLKEGLQFCRQDQANEKEYIEMKRKEKEDEEKKVIMEVNKLYHRLLNDLSENRKKIFLESYNKLKDYEQYGFKTLLYKNPEKARQRMNNIQYMKFSIKEVFGKRELCIDMGNDD